MEISRNQFKEKIMKLVFLVTAMASIIAVIVICGFLFVNGVPAIKEIGVKEFLLGMECKRYSASCL